MTHLGFIVVSYVLALGVPMAFAVDATRRLGRARRKLDAIDPRRRSRDSDEPLGNRP